MKLVTYRLGQKESRLGVIQDSLIIDVQNFGERIDLSLPSSMLEFIDLGSIAVSSLSEILSKTKARDFVGVSVPIENAKILAPIPRPRKNIFGIGLNYTEHIAESARSLDTSSELPQEPIIFSKFPTAVIGDGEPICHNQKITQQLDWEAELAVVIGKKCNRVDKADALQHVFGYTVINDISARDCRRAGQWVVSKSQYSFAPMGPCIVTADEIKDPHNLNISCHVNGTEKQNSNTKFMLFNINDLIEDISQGLLLEPGDIIATGTPAGVGAGRDPQEFMWPGDVLETSIEGIGKIRNPIIAV
ncbi:MAG: fumarylacetoacetate hydrolase family protein [Pseudomonadota bacterium]|jgi:2-keto-4-pentenoate hydratase/2-oxohepta-3-ene-1,7-dioic acid hydratase in catechol pathway|nr:fumarylacetoacetate hydrolase family protein [Pseudomonadota bacterium]